MELRSYLSTLAKSKLILYIRVSESLMLSAMKGLVEYNETAVAELITQRKY